MTCELFLEVGRVVGVWCEVCGVAKVVGWLSLMSFVVFLLVSCGCETRDGTREEMNKKSHVHVWAVAVNVAADVTAEVNVDVNVERYASFHDHVHVQRQIDASTIRTCVERMLGRQAKGLKMHGEERRKPERRATY